jgi:transcription antitermination factor NusG
MPDLVSLNVQDSFASIMQVPGKWHLLHTKSRQEKAVSETLTSKGIAHYLALVQVARTYGGRKVSVNLPLFPGYLFLRGSLDDLYAADRTKRIANIIPVLDQDKLTWELHNLSIALTNTVSLDPYPYLRIGLKVEVRAGPLMGLQGIIENRLKRDRLILQVDVLGQATSLEIDGALLTVIE